MKLNNILLAGAASVGMAGLSLIGVGAHAAFTTSTSSHQKITAGTPVVYLTAPGTSCTSVANKCTSLTLPDVGPVGSTFDSSPTQVTIHNAGNIPVTEGSVQFSATTNGASGNYLEQQTYVCLASDPGSGGTGAGGETVVANGRLATGLALSPSVTLVGPTVAPGGTDEYNVDFYAGENSATCGTTWSDGPHTASSWSGGHPWATPASLDNNAEGGTVAVTVSFNYTA